ncbi:Phosphatidylinositol 4-kinase STT4 [Wickerhamiella sorbophila]|uniref:1-phosphatidylinositol 4-kinase n=1 Tax=Wickerhamiella sorbophila TaxID=45607 RepID=A0A2T0FML2_9ASCO|nr:Phosphatidylinositol 4-kinase STT4 [Wickerhamiella sorbophila]PRT56209.1 Phosphatidylinositol 4-kinase STT4 [Wickerhamiella sorbophila]
MDYWGIDRSKSSIRLKALRKIGALDAVEPQNDLTKMSAVLKDSVNNPEAALYPRELEVLLALVDSVPKTIHPERFKSMIPLLQSFLMRLPHLNILPGPAVRRIDGPSPWTLLARGLVESLQALHASEDNVPEMLQGLRDAWESNEQSDGEFLIWLFALHGALEGLNSRPIVRLQPAKMIFEWICDFLSDSTLSDIGTRLDSIETKLNKDATSVDAVPAYFLTLIPEDSLAYPGPSQLRLSMSRFFAEIAIYASGGESQDSTANDNELLAAVAKQSAHFLGRLVENNTLVVDAPHFGPVVSRSVQYNHRVIALSVGHNEFDASEAFQIALVGMELDQTLTGDSTEFEPLRLALACCHVDSSRLATLVKALPMYFGSLSPSLAGRAADLYASSVRSLPQSWLISAVYALGNSLTTEELEMHRHSVQSTASSVLSGLVGMVISQSDVQLRALALSILSQKFGTVDETVDIEVLVAVSKLGPHLPERDFETALFLIERASGRKSADVKKWLAVIRRARIIISRELYSSHPSYKVYLEHLLGLMISVGEASNSTISFGASAALSSTLSGATGLSTGNLPLSRNATRQSANGSEKRKERPERRTVLSPHLSPAEQIVEFLEPLAALLPPKTSAPLEVTDWSLISRFRDAWFNMAVLGYNVDYKWTKEQSRHLETIAWSTPPLVTELSVNNVESDLDLNPVLRRGSKGHHGREKQHRVVAGLFKATTNIDIKPTYVRIMFLATSNMVERFRARAGAISKSLLYFGDPDLRDGEGFKGMYSIAAGCANAYISDVKTGRKGAAFGLEKAAEQLKEILVLCCHRVDTIRDVAFDMADLVISRIPAALCTQTAMFALLDLLSMMHLSCVNAESDEYEPCHTYVGEKSGVTVALGDSYSIRRHTLDRLLDSARTWTSRITSTMGPNLKAILGFYLEDGDKQADEEVALGRSFALQIGGASSQNGSLFEKPQSLYRLDGVSGFLSNYLSISALRLQTREHSVRVSYEEVRAEIDRLLSLKNPRPDSVTLSEIRTLYMHASAYLVDCSPQAMGIAKDVVHLAFRFFDGKIMAYCINYWLWIVNQTPSLRLIVLQAIAEHWSRSIARKIGLFSRKYDQKDPMVAHMEYKPSSKRATTHEIRHIEKLYAPHVLLTNFLISMTHSSLLINEEHINVLARIIADAMYGLAHYASLHSLARGPRLALVRLAMDFIVPYSHRAPTVAAGMRSLVTAGILAWFKQPVQWPFGGNTIQLRQDIALLEGILERARKVPTSPASDICQSLLADELNKLQVWNDPLGNTKAGHAKISFSVNDVIKAWNVDPQIAVALVTRHADVAAEKKLVELIEDNPLAVYDSPAALTYLLQASPTSKRAWQVIYWTPVSEIMCINLFSPQYGGGSYLLQYSVRALESHPVTDCFFYVPQIVQALRHDSGGFVAEYILEAAKFSQLFAHQIIWNILANSYKDDEGEVPDGIKPIVDRVLEKMMEEFTDKERDFYDTEFNFFNEVTSISGKLKPYIKKSKAEKKAKIDEEMAQIVVPEGVYLPSNPHGTVVDIDRESGRPLQSHAKAPFLAKFKIHKDQESGEDTDSDSDEPKAVEVWQGAIFKVGDDCRQDVLVLQIISVFRSIFAYSGLDLYVFPYKVTATAPGCGVIDVLPNSTSRDMLGREAVNGLYEWYISKHGNEDSIDFQRARNNFVKSLAAYSVISYLLQFKDRHNGNIMYDDDGHVIHIDFGFCFEIVPGGVKFEAVPFKLTKEMVAVMGGNTNTQAYRWFEELCVKAFLSCRVYAEDICRMVAPMLESGLPCFKGDTIRKLRNRFVLNKSEREAANFMRGLISRSYESNFTKGYDEFQRLTNGIPY